MDPNAYNVGWICALPLEFAASQAMLDNLHDNVAEQHSYDRNNYCLGNIGGHSVVMACLPDGRYGIGSAETVATNMLRTFPSIKLGLMVGIGGGVPSDNHDIRLGDVVVSKPNGQHGGVVNYEIGRVSPGGEFRMKGHLNKPPLELLNALSRLESAHEMDDPKIETYINQALEKHPNMQQRYSFPGVERDLLYLTECDHAKASGTCFQCETLQSVGHSEQRRRTNPKVHYGLIGSGSKVIASIQERDKLKREYGIICFETEAAGLMDSFPCLVIRGISDYADSYKGKDWQRYAALAAAAYAKELLQVLPRAQVARMQDVKTSNDDAQSNDNSHRWLQKFRGTGVRIPVLLIGLCFLIGLSSMAMEYLWPSRSQQDVKTSDQSTLFSCIDRSVPVFVVMGNTGVGKSTFIDILGGRDCNNRRPAVDCADEFSCTSNITFYKASLDNGNNVYLIDTPGFEDVRAETEMIKHRSDEEIMYNVYNSLTSIYPGDKLVRGLIYLHDISKPRLSKPLLEHSNLFHVLCGKDRYDSVALVLNKWSSTWEEEIKQQKRKTNLRNKYWAEIINLGSHLEDHDGSRVSANRILSNLHDRSTKIQYSVQNGIKEQHILHLTEYATDDEEKLDKPPLNAQKRDAIRWDHSIKKFCLLMLRLGATLWLDCGAIAILYTLLSPEKHNIRQKTKESSRQHHSLTLAVMLFCVPIFNCLIFSRPKSLLLGLATAFLDTYVVAVWLDLFGLRLLDESKYMWTVLACIFTICNILES